MLGSLSSRLNLPPSNCQTELSGFPFAFSCARLTLPSLLAFECFFKIHKPRKRVGVLMILDVLHSERPDFLDEAEVDNTTMSVFLEPPSDPQKIFGHYKRSKRRLQVPLGQVPLAGCQEVSSQTMRRQC